MATAYRTKQGDTVDLIARAHYGATDAGQVEAVLEANRALDLGSLGPVLPENMTITLPDVAPVVRAPTVRLWT